MLRVSDPDLIAHWPFRENLKDHSKSGLSIQNYGVEIGESGGQRSAQFNAAETFLEVPCDLSIGTGDFSFAGWIHTDESEVVGDILSQFDPETRQGLTRISISFPLAIPANVFWPFLNLEVWFSSKCVRTCDGYSAMSSGQCLQGRLFSHQRMVLLTISAASR